MTIGIRLEEDMNCKKKRKVVYVAKKKETVMVLGAFVLYMHMQIQIGRIFTRSRAET